MCVKKIIRTNNFRIFVGTNFIIFHDEMLRMRNSVIVQLIEVVLRAYI